MNIHKKALGQFGITGRIEKLREEALELALACDRYLSRKGSMYDVYREAADVHTVTMSLVENDVELWQERTVLSREKLEYAVSISCPPRAEPNGPKEA